MNIIKIQNKVRNEEYEISLHAEKERYDEDISLRDIETTILSGAILENYPEDSRGKSCLIVGRSRGRAIHVVCGLTTMNWVRIITVYLPKEPKWIDAETRGSRG